jgi:hypothetical protein
MIVQLEHEKHLHTVRQVLPGDIISNAERETGDEHAPQLLPLAGFQTVRLVTTGCAVGSSAQQLVVIKNFGY